MMADAVYISSPYFWIALSALFMGITLSKSVSKTSSKRDPDSARTHKWVWVCIHLTFSIIFGLAALFIPGPEKIQDIRILYFFLSLSLFFFLAFRFKRSVGSVSFILILLLVLVVVMFLQSISAFTGETEIAKIRILNIQEPFMKLEINLPKKEPIFTVMEGEYFAPVVRVIIFEDFFVFLGVKTWYRFDGITSFDMEEEEGQPKFRQQNTDYYFTEKRNISDDLYFWLEKHDASVPGIKSVQVELDLKKAKELSTYSIRIQNDGGVQIIDESVE